MENLGTPFSALQKIAFPWVRCPKRRHPLTATKPKIETQSFVEIDRRIHNNEADVIEDTGWFSAWITCPGCGERLSAAGKWNNDFDFDNDERQSYTTDFYPRWFSHPPELLRSPDRAPKKVKAEIERAAVLFWVDLFACATALRRVVELFLDVQRVPRRADGRFLSLGNRIERYVRRVPDARAPQLKRFLHAVRLVGNEGTHGSDIGTNEVVLMVEWIRRFLQLKYPERDPVIQAAAARERRQRRHPRSAP